MHARRMTARTIGPLAAILTSTLLGIGTARAQNVAPVISGSPPGTAVPGRAYEFRPTATDANGDRISFGATGVPRWARFDKKTGRLYGTPGSRDLGLASEIRITAWDGKLSAALPKFTLTVVASGAAPSISGTPATTVREKELYGFVPQASDPDGDPLTFSIANKPSWATFTSSSGLLSGIPPAGSAGTYSNIVISVSDGSSTRSLPAFAVSVVKAANAIPVISGIPPTSVKAGTPYSFRPTASDPDGQSLRFSVQNLPTWATLDTATGTMTGTASNAQAGSYSSIVISVTDGIATASLAPFSISVQATNSLPRIGGTPATSVTAGQAYSFTPTASDPEGQRLTFSIAGKPAWAAFDAATGRLYGTPSESHVGTASGIVISASDGIDSAALPAFSVQVRSASVSRSAALSWLPPTSNVDGTPVTNLAGYRIAYGQNASSLNLSLNIPSPAVTSAVIENLATGTWYFAVKAYTTANVESDLSNLAQKIVN